MNIIHNSNVSLFFEGGTGLLDPCEKDKTDASIYLPQQEREDITAAAQVCFFYIIHSFLDYREA